VAVTRAIIVGIGPPWVIKPGIIIVWSGCRQGIPEIIVIDIDQWIAVGMFAYLSEMVPFDNADYREGAAFFVDLWI
jgi:hypothetical protein